MRTRWQLYAGVAVLAQFLLAPGISMAVAGAISQSYRSNDTSIVQGTILSFEPSNSNVVDPANSTSSSGNLIGIAADKPLLELNNGTGQSVKVVVGGSTVAWVSDLNGPVKSGDKIAASPITGVGMKATTAGEIVGVAQSDLASQQTITKTVTTQSGKDVSVKVGLLPVSVSVGYYSGPPAAGTTSAYVPAALQALADAITGKSVSPLRVLLGTLALLLGFGIAAVMLSTSIRSEIVSIGRNPLARASLLKALLGIVLSAMGILMLTLIAVYLILRT